MTPRHRRLELEAVLIQFRATYRSAKKANRPVGIKAMRSAIRAVTKDLREAIKELAS